MDFLSTWKRITDETELKKLVHLAKFIGVSQAFVSKKKKENDFPVEWAFKIAQQYNLSTDWLITGDGEKHHFRSPSVDPFLREIWEWLDECIKDDPGYRDWFRIQFEKKFTEFKDWKTKKRSSEIQDPSFPEKKIA